MRFACVLVCCVVCACKILWTVGSALGGGIFEKTSYQIGGAKPQELAAYAPPLRFGSWRGVCGYDLILDALVLRTISLLFGTHTLARTHVAHAALHRIIITPFGLRGLAQFCMAHKILESIIYSSLRISQLLFHLSGWQRTCVGRSRSAD